MKSTNLFTITLFCVTVHVCVCLYVVTQYTILLVFPNVRLLHELSILKASYPTLHVQLLVQKLAISLYSAALN